MAGNRPPAAISPDEAALFRAAVEDASPIVSDGRIAPQPVPPAVIANRRLREEQPIAGDALSDHQAWDNGADADDALLFLRSGLRRDTLRKLRRGHWLLQAELDLHGMVSVEARQAIVAFLAYCHQHDFRCVRIIHGKGLSSKNHAAVLRNKVKNWLMQRDDVLAFCQARAIDGGSGAVVVLLKAG